MKKVESSQDRDEKNQVSGGPWMGPWKGWHLIRGGTEKCSKHRTALQAKRKLKKEEEMQVSQTGCLSFMWFITSAQAKHIVFCHLGTLRVFLSKKSMVNSSGRCKYVERKKEKNTGPRTRYFMKKGVYLLSVEKFMLYKWFHLWCFISIIWMHCHTPWEQSECDVWFWAWVFFLTTTTTHMNRAFHGHRH